MGEIADRLDRMEIRALSPDKNIEAVVRTGGGLSVTMQPHAYEHYSESALVHQLERLATLAMTGYTRGYRMATESSGKDSGPTFDRRRREYREELARLVNHGSSQSGAVQARTVGMMNWQVTIAKGTLSRLSEAEFIGEMQQALGSLVQDNRVESAGLKERHFGLDMSPALKEQMKSLRRRPT